MRLSAPVYRLKRRARLLARDENIPLHAAQDRIARDEGFPAWSLLSARLAPSTRAGALLPALVDGDMLLIGGRPGQGKTRMGLNLLLDAARDGRRAVFFTLEFTEPQARAHLQALTAGDRSARSFPAPEIVTSDDISADVIIRHLAGARPGTVAVIDYLQILDQQRSKPPLHDQIVALRAHAHRTGGILAFLSQIDRAFDPEPDAMPDVGDIRLVNAIPEGAFSKACFLHAGVARMQSLT